MFWVSRILVASGVFRGPVGCRLLDDVRSFRLDDFADLEFFHHLTSVGTVADILERLAGRATGLLQQNLLTTGMLNTEKNRESVINLHIILDQGL